MGFCQCIREIKAINSFVPEKYGAMGYRVEKLSVVRDQKETCVQLLQELLKIQQSGQI